LRARFAVVLATKQQGERRGAGHLRISEPMKVEAAEEMSGVAAE
jgi:hypothetical protein